MISNFLDFYDIVVNQLVGSPVLFIILTLIVVTFVLVKSRAPSEVYLMVLFVIVGILAIQFPILRWFVAIGLGYVGWMTYKAGRG